ncbi:vWA domain-containing protein [Desertimonas flava]|jgi:Ca-activated chloride channel family protein|uniref:vWA domain-containing protein n=1 Tax=Desertimonas flava TaxID=2064846 RepID=UPI000E356D63|nr:von Willebrand factor type A domain-containing protein [Desertimonas flava]
MRYRLVPLALSLAVSCGILAGTTASSAHAAGGDPAGCAPIAADDASATDESAADPPDDSMAEPVDADDLDSRCDIDPASYYLGYTSPPMDADGAVVYAAPPGGPAQTTGGVPMPAVAEADAAAVEPGPPMIPLPPDEPGITEDNTFVDAGDSTWVTAQDDRESTFALDVDTGSMSVARTFLDQGLRPEPDSIRPEEWINSFDFGDPPATDGALAATVESRPADGDDPALVRIGITTAELADEDRPPANITFVIDTSGSMDIRERLGLVKASLALLVRSLRTDDTISIVTYGDDATPVLAPTAVADWRDIVDAIDALGPGGSTNMEAGLRLGYEQARENLDPEGLNVVVLASDGVANVGVTDADELTADITQASEDGIHLVTVGYGMGNYNDHLMEQLSNQGDGFYSYVDTFGEAVRLFVDELTPTLTVVAAEAKVQVVFDPEVVARYRLVGYENRQLDDADFTDDTVDAGELGAGHAVSALYELELVDQEAAGRDTSVAGNVRLRWADPATDEVTETETPIDLADGDASSTTLRFAALVANTAEVLKGGSVVTERGVSLEDLLVEAEALAADGVEGAADMAEVITLAIHAQPIDTVSVED